MQSKSHSSQILLIATWVPFGQSLTQVSLYKFVPGSQLLHVFTLVVQVAHPSHTLHSPPIYTVPSGQGFTQSLFKSAKSPSHEVQALGDMSQVAHPVLQS